MQKFHVNVNKKKTRLLPVQVGANFTEQRKVGRGAPVKRASTRHLQTFMGSAAWCAMLGAQ